MNSSLWDLPASVPLSYYPSLYSQQCFSGLKILRCRHFILFQGYHSYRSGPRWLIKVIFLVIGMQPRRDTYPKRGYLELSLGSVILMSMHLHSWENPYLCTGNLHENAERNSYKVNCMQHKAAGAAMKLAHLGVHKLNRDARILLRSLIVTVLTLDCAAKVAAWQSLPTTQIHACVHGIQALIRLPLHALGRHVSTLVPNGLAGNLTLNLKQKL